MLRIFFLLLISTSLCAQKIDDTQVFSLEKYLEWVRQYHPVMQQAGLLESRADANILAARGSLDPKWFGNYEDKSFDQKNYFRVGEAGLKIPTWWGIDIKAAYLWSNGDFLNPAENLPINGQALIGVEVPVLQGLLFDQRRAQIKQAELFMEVNEATRRSMTNNLLLEAIESYWFWAYKYEVVNIYQTSLDLAEIRFENILESFRQGDKPAIDTLESMIQVQNRQLDLSQALVELDNAALDLSTYLWYENLVPVEISDQLRPEALAPDWTLAGLDIAIPVLQELENSHPNLQMLVAKQKQLDIKEKLKREQFKPQLNFTYNFLGNGFDLSGENIDVSRVDNLFLENYKWGLTFSYPLLLRKERAGLQLVKLEQLETNYKIKNKQLQINNKIQSTLQLLATTEQQLAIIAAMVSNYELLLAAENEKLRIGESSIFLINSREQKLIEAQLKSNKLQLTIQKLRWKLQWTMGRLL